MDDQIPNRFYRVSIKGLVLDETRTKFLIVQEDNGKWELPGGGLDWGETPEEGLRREIQEEMGLSITSMKTNPSYFFTMKRNAIHIANVLYEITLGSLDFVASDECIAIRFVTPSEAKAMANETFPNIQILAEMFDPKNHEKADD